MPLRHLPALLALILVTTLARPVNASTLGPISETEVADLVESLTALKLPQGVKDVYSTDLPPVGKRPKARYQGFLQNSAIHEDNPPLIRLVELGAHALPVLLKHLDDARETPLYVSNYRPERTMDPGGYLDYRPGNSVEERALAAAGLATHNPGPDLGSDLDSYRLTVGDICFALVGMITNRSYYAIVGEFGPQLNSPTQCKAIATAVRAIWGDSPGDLELYGHLKRDLESGHAPFADAAATRLLYYFPNLSQGLAKHRLRQLSVEHGFGDGELPSYLAAIDGLTSPPTDAAIRKTVLSIDDARVVRAGAASFADAGRPENHAELIRLSNKLKLRKDPAYVDASRTLLRLNLLNFPERGEETVRSFLDGAGLYARHSVLLVSEAASNPPVAALRPLLSIPTEIPSEHYFTKGGTPPKGATEEDYLPYRICDRAYEVISRILGDKGTVCAGTHSEMNARITKLSQRLGGEPSSWPFRSKELEARQRERGPAMRTAKTR